MRIVNDVFMRDAITAYVAIRVGSVTKNAPLPSGKKGLPENLNNGVYHLSKPRGQTSDRRSFITTGRHPGPLQAPSWCHHCTGTSLANSLR